MLCSDTMEVHFFQHPESAPNPADLGGYSTSIAISSIKYYASRSDEQTAELFKNWEAAIQQKYAEHEASMQEDQEEGQLEAPALP